MTESDFKEIGISTLGARRKLQLAISGLFELPNSAIFSRHIIIADFKDKVWSAGKFSVIIIIQGYMYP